MSAAAPEHPFLNLLAHLPDRFPELKGNDEMAQIARMVVIPSIRAAAKKEPDKIREAVVAFLARFVVGLEIRPEEIYRSGELAETTRALGQRDTDLALEEAAPAPDPKLERILAGDE